MTVSTTSSDLNEQLDELKRDLLAMVDIDLQAEHLASSLHVALDAPVVSVATGDAAGSMRMAATRGTKTVEFGQLRFSAGQGLGGIVIESLQPAVVSDYASDPRITRDFVRVVSEGEEIRGIAAVPIVADREVLGVMYAGTRSVGSLSGQSVELMERVGRAAAPCLQASIGAKRIMGYFVSTERQRIAGLLHDDVGQLLFGIAVAVTQLQIAGGDLAGVHDLIDDIQRDVIRASSGFRHTLRWLAPQGEADRLPTAVFMDLQDFSRRTGIWSQPLIVGTPSPQATEVCDRLVRRTRKVLHWLENAAASVVIVTLDFRQSEVSLKVEFDGPPEQGSLPTWPVAAPSAFETGTPQLSLVRLTGGSPDAYADPGSPI